MDSRAYFSDRTCCTCEISDEWDLSALVIEQEQRKTNLPFPILWSTCALSAASFISIRTTFVDGRFALSSNSSLFVSESCLS